MLWVENLAVPCKDLVLTHGGNFASLVRASSSSETFLASLLKVVDVVDNKDIYVQALAQSEPCV